MVDEKRMRKALSHKGDMDYWMNRGLDDIITDYVRQKVMGSPSNIHDYIEDLMEIEMLLIEGPDCVAGIHALREARRKYPEEYRIISSELNMGWVRSGTEDRFARGEEAWVCCGGRPHESYADHLLEFVKEQERIRSEREGLSRDADKRRSEP